LSNVILINKKCIFLKHNKIIHQLHPFLSIYAILETEMEVFRRTDGGQDERNYKKQLTVIPNIGIFATKKGNAKEHISNLRETF
jgi:hypothetical protein